MAIKGQRSASAVQYRFSKGYLFGSFVSSLSAPYLIILFHIYTILRNELCKSVCNLSVQMDGILPRIEKIYILIGHVLVKYF